MTALALTGATLPEARAQTNEIIYSNSLQNGWVSWGWATINFSCTSPVLPGCADSISVYCTNYTALYLHQTPSDSTPFTNLTFWLNGGASGGQVLTVTGTLNQVNQANYTLPALAANTWQQFTVPLAAMGLADQPDFDGIWIWNLNNFTNPTFYVDNIVLVGGTVVVTTNAVAAITIDAQENRHPISPQIYGTAFATSNELSDLNFTMNRSGGNNETRYNWQINAHNLDADWYFESYPDSSSAAGATADSFVANSKSGGAQPMITIPMIGWSPIVGAGRSILYSYAVSKYGLQTSVDPWLTNAGSGVGSNAVTGATWLITTNNPNDANFPTNTAFQQGYVQHLMGAWGASTNGGVGYYIMDNEHSIWFSTHQDIHPVGPTMQEIWTRMLATASMVKSNDPNVLVLGPEEWGWNGYLYSGYDQQWSGQHGDYNPADYPDRATNGGRDYMPWLLNQFYQYNTNTGQRLLDYFTLHCYPQEVASDGGQVSGDDVSTATELLRNESTRQFWDTNYVDPSWINSVIMLIPRIKSWVSTYYPGTKIGITEYNWGAEASINGATAQADLLGIFGWQGLDLATRWTTPTNTVPTYLAMKIYRNYDGNKSTFGDTSISATGTDPDDISTFAAVRSVDGALTAMVVNKQLTGVQPLTMTISNFYSSGTAQVWQLTSSNVITRLANVSLTGNTLSNSVPPQSITLFVLPAGTNPPPPMLAAGTVSATNRFDFWLTGQSGQSYIIQGSSNLMSWSPVQTNLLTNSPVLVAPAATNAPYRFYRALWVP